MDKWGTGEMDALEALGHQTDYTPSWSLGCSHFLVTYLLDLPKTT